jgi:histidine ammonia-lyase
MIELGRAPLSIHDIENIVFFNANASIFANAIKKIDQTYKAISLAALEDRPLYGINTGFGALAEIRIDPHDQASLQRNIILSHAVGVGEPLDFYTAKALTLLRLNTLVQGYSGTSPQLIDHLLKIINSNCAPFVPKKGSVGASGDLAPLAHLGLLLLGIGQAYIDHQLVSAQEALKFANIEALSLGQRDGLALINGTQAMSAVGIIALLHAIALNKVADVAGAISLEALGGHDAPFDERMQAVKPHPGQIKTARNIQNIIRGRKKEALLFNQKTQDPYSLRCMPQVHGAVKDVVAHVLDVVLRELNSATDNPLIFLNEEKGFDIVSGGNFHGQHIALSLDYLAIGIASLGTISERRIELLLNPHYSNGLPAFLIDDSGLNSGYMMLHVTACALVNENKILGHPAAIDSIPTSANREDHVSMGMNAANKLIQIIDNVRLVLAIEIMAGCQALDLRQKDYQSPQIKKFRSEFRKLVPFRKQDGLIREDLINTLSWLSLKDTSILIDEILSPRE